MSPPAVADRGPALDVLRLPLLGRLLRWRWGRLVFQLILLALAALCLYDGFSGPDLAPANAATVLVWVHSRGLVVLGLLLLGNLFCFACPFALPRTLARRWARPGRRFPRRLRNKWVSLGALFVIFWAYEGLDLWASPWLTAWLIAAYFVGSFALEAAFSESPFCKYVCPLGAFNFAYATVSPLQIQARDAGTCRTCPGKECVRGGARASGCGTELFVPVLQSNLDCVLCLDCSRACPYDNVALAVRRPLAELVRPAWPQRWDAPFLVVALAWFGLVNAFAMTSPVYALSEWMARAAGLHSEVARLGLILAGGALAPAALITFGGAWLSERLTPRAARRGKRRAAVRYAPAFVPLGLGIYTAHYGFHLALGGLSIVPVLQTLAIDHGLGWLAGTPRWDLGPVLPLGWIFPLQVLAVLAGLGAALYVLSRRAMSTGLEPAGALRQLAPWAAAVALAAALALAVFSLPMEARVGLPGPGG